MSVVRTITLALLMLFLLVGCGGVSEVTVTLEDTSETEESFNETSTDQETLNFPLGGPRGRLEPGESGTLGANYDEIDGLLGGVRDNFDSLLSGLFGASYGTMPEGGSGSGNLNNPIIERASEEPLPVATVAELPTAAPTAIPTVQPTQEPIVITDPVPEADQPSQLGGMTSEAMNACYSLWSYERGLPVWYPADFAPQPHHEYWCFTNYNGVVEWAKVDLYYTLVREGFRQPAPPVNPHW